MDQLFIKFFDIMIVVDLNKFFLYCQCGYYYEIQKLCIGQDENNECLSEEEYIQRLFCIVEIFDVFVMSLEQKCENRLYNGFIYEWKVGNFLSDG